MSLDGDDCNARESVTGISATADSRAVRTASGCRKMLKCVKVKSRKRMYLGIDVFQTSHNYTSKGFSKLLLLVERLCVTNGAIQTLLVLQPIHILGAVGIQVLQTAGELVI